MRGAAALLCIAPALAMLRGCDDGITCGPVVANYICGSKDSSILCNHDYALRTEEYIAEGFKYTYLEVDCGHDLTSPSCSEHEKVYAAIIAHIQDAMIVAAIT